MWRESSLGHSFERATAKAGWHRLGLVGRCLVRPLATVIGR